MPEKSKYTFSRFYEFTKRCKASLTTPFIPITTPEVVEPCNWPKVASPRPRCSLEHFQDPEEDGQ